MTSTKLPLFERSPAAKLNAKWTVAQERVVEEYIKDPPIPIKGRGKDNFAQMVEYFHKHSIRHSTIQSLRNKARELVKRGRIPEPKYLAFNSPEAIQGKDLAKQAPSNSHRGGPVTVSLGRGWSYTLTPAQQALAIERYLTEGARVAAYRTFVKALER